MISLYDVLKASKGLPANDPIAGIWGRKLAGGKNQETEGTLPLTISANGENLIDYRIYGASGGVGEKTVNLFTKNTRRSGFYSSSGYFNNNPYYTTSNAIAINNDLPVIGNIVSTNYGGYYMQLAFFDELMNFISVHSVSMSGTGQKNIQTEPPIDAAFVIFCSTANSYNIMVVNGSTAPTKYIPYGYQLSATIGDGTTGTDIPIYIGSTPLEQGEYVDYGEQKVYKYVDGVLTPTDPPVALPAIPTLDGTTVYDADLVTKPSKMYVKYRKH